jgi:hypothetical protein
MKSTYENYDWTVLRDTLLPPAIASVVVQVHTKKYHDLSLRRLRNLLQTVAVLKERFSGAEFVYDLANVIMQALPQNLEPPLQNHTSPFSPVHTATSTIAGSQIKAKALKRAFDLIRDSFALKKSNLNFKVHFRC